MKTRAGRPIRDLQQPELAWRQVEGPAGRSASSPATSFWTRSRATSSRGTTVLDRLPRQEPAAQHSEKLPGHQSSQRSPTSASATSRAAPRLTPSDAHGCGMRKAPASDEVPDQPGQGGTGHHEHDVDLGPLDRRKARETSRAKTSTPPASGNSTWIPNDTARFSTTPTTAAVSARQSGRQPAVPRNFSMCGRGGRESRAKK